MDLNAKKKIRGNQCGQKSTNYCSRTDLIFYSNNCTFKIYNCGSKQQAFFLRHARNKSPGIYLEIIISQLFGNTSSAFICHNYFRQNTSQSLRFVVGAYVHITNKQRIHTCAWGRGGCSRSLSIMCIIGLQYVKSLRL